MTFCLIQILLKYVQMIIGDEMNNNILAERRSVNAYVRSGDVRTPYERDRGRIIHSAAFRRLQSKTQILGIGGGDFHRTRLTHSMEVSQICRGLILRFQDSSDLSEQVKLALPPEELSEAVGLAHDIGHPPFGHGGECVLNYYMQDYGGFEANGQTLRLLSKLEAHTVDYGLDLTRRLLLGILKYPVMYSDVKAKQYKDVPADMDMFNPTDFRPPKCYHDCDRNVVDWILSPFSKSDVRLFTDTIKSVDVFEHAKSIYKSLDTTIMDVSDDIAYGTHDLEDGIALNMIGRDLWETEVAGQIEAGFSQRFGLQKIADLLFDKSKDRSHNRKRGMGAIIHSLINSVVIRNSQKFESDLFNLNATLEPAAQKFLDALQAITLKHMIDLHTVKTFEYRGQRILMSLINAFTANPYKLMTPTYVEQYELATSEAAQKRVICDYIAGMTDEYANRMYERLFVPRHGNVFEQL